MEPEQLDRIDAKLTDWIGATHASTLLQLLRARPGAEDPTKNPRQTVGLIEQLHDAVVEHGDHELADLLLEWAGWPARYWVPSCTAGTRHLEAPAHAATSSRGAGASRTVE